MDQPENRQFEEKMKRLEEIIAALDSPGISLEDGISLYKEGVLCSRFCREKLENARHELEIWQDGKAVAFDQEDDDGENGE